jgi:hypothetical protein
MSETLTKPTHAERDAFYQQYHGQAVGVQLVELREPNRRNVLIQGGYYNYIELRDWKSITEDELNEMMDLICLVRFGCRPNGYDGLEYNIQSECNSHKLRMKKMYQIKNHRLWPWEKGFESFYPVQIDYLRSIGILVQFRQYSPEQILEFGWAKIKTETPNE